ncbi:MAG: response regulator transcription factor [Chloroflexota bacterium]
MKPITIVVVDDHPIFRQGVVDSLDIEEDLQVIGQAGNGNTALELIRRLRPDIAVLDINLPDINGQQITHQIVTEKIPTKVILLTAYDDHEQALHAVRGGARAYCSKDVQPESLVEIIHMVMEGKYILRQRVMSYEEIEAWKEEQTLMAERAYSDPGQPYKPLSSREMEVLILMTRGLSNKEIALRLDISHQTVKNHVTAVLRKLGVEDRTQAAVFALQRGWVRMYQMSGKKTAKE